MTYERVELPVGALRDIETYAQAARMDPADMAGDLFRSGLTLFDELAQAKGWAHARATFNALCQPDQPKQMAACYTTLDTRKMLRRISDESACRPKHWPAVRFFMHFMTGSARSSHSALWRRHKNARVMRASCLWDWIST